eukprot:10531288-Alexandrium_andersonii.AAC.1
MCTKSVGTVAAASAMGSKRAAAPGALAVVPRGSSAEAVRELDAVHREPAVDIAVQEAGLQRGRRAAEGGIGTGAG